MLNANAYGFVQTIARRFDHQQFPGSVTPDLLLKRKNGTVVQHIEVQKIAECPRDIRCLIFAQAANFSQWSVLTGLCDPNIQQNPFAVNFSAGKLLEKIQVVRDENQSNTNQLLATVFEKVFESCTEEEKLGLINQMNSCKTVLESTSFKFQFLVFRAQSFAAAFFSSTVVKYVLGGIVAWQARKFYGFVYNYVMHSAKTKFVPRAVNLFINNAPTWAVKVTSVFIGAIVYIVDNPWKLRIGSLIAVVCAGTYSPYVNRIQTIVLFPITITDMIAGIPFSVANRAFGISTAVQNKLSQISTAGKDNAKNKIIAEGAPKAYQLWKHLMMNPQQLYA